jgi:hypothetical protein
MSALGLCSAGAMASGVPHGVRILIRLMADGVVTVEQIERAAVPISARLNGGAEPSTSLSVQGVTVDQVEQVSAWMNGGAKSEPSVVEPPSELALVEPAPEQFALAGVFQGPKMKCI